MAYTLKKYYFSNKITLLSKTITRDCTVEFTRYVRLNKFAGMPRIARVSAGLFDSLLNPSETLPSQPPYSPAILLVLSCSQCQLGCLYTMSFALMVYKSSEFTFPRLSVLLCMKKCFSFNKNKILQN